MNLLDELKKCEGSMTQISNDAGVSRQAAYQWNGGLPRREIFDKLLAMDKYKEVLGGFDYDKARGGAPLGYPVGRKNKK